MPTQRRWRTSNESAPAPTLDTIGQSRKISKPTSHADHQLNSLPCLRGPICLPLSGFTHCFALSSKCFSIFPHGTCSLSDSWSYLAFDGVYHRLHLVLTNKATLRTSYTDTGCTRYGSCTLLGMEPHSGELAHANRTGKDVLHATVPVTVASNRIRRWAWPISLAVTIGIPVGFFSSA